MVTINVKCRFCQQTSAVSKYGVGHGGHQRYRCKQCCRTFQLEYTYIACKPGIKEHIIELAMNNAGIRNSARMLHISVNAVVRTLKTYT
ncbi:IS1 family transposase [Candidatus Enterovibrio altilux]|uniref:IS1 protein n=1 Tax=Candidatus Enterovibrio altilux TaxID=1927128 RepID=A0A291B780_9GAMM|nr:IS1 family transposase [Candidatus Enterovibrio luxaltus]ATF08836.1 IS1 protein [Candidatus Enterovibrio luxaltus]